MSKDILHELLGGNLRISGEARHINSLLDLHRRAAREIGRLRNDNAAMLDALEELRDWYVEVTGLPPVKANIAITKAKGGENG